jgi:hypothetical protein
VALAALAFTGSARAVVPQCSGHGTALHDATHSAFAEEHGAPTHQGSAPSAAASEHGAGVPACPAGGHAAMTGCVAVVPLPSSSALTLATIQLVDRSNVGVDSFHALLAASSLFRPPRA